MTPVLSNTRDLILVLKGRALLELCAHVLPSPSVIAALSLTSKSALAVPSSEINAILWKLPERVSRYEALSVTVVPFSESDEV